MPRTFSGGTSLIGAALTPLSHSTTGDATYTELYVPVTMPTRNANAKLCTPSPPKKYRITTTINTVNTVRIVRLKRLIHRVVDHLRGDIRRLAFDFAQAVERYDRVVHRKTNDRQQRGDDRQIDLEGVDPQRRGKPGTASTMYSLSAIMPIVIKTS